MKKLALLLVVLVFASCKKESNESFGQTETTTEESATTVAQSPEKLGKQIFETKGACVACHKISEKLIGPSLQDIAKIYKDKNGDMVSFFKGNGEAIVDPTQYEIMKPNLELTKTFSDEELKGLEAYVNSHLK